MSDLLDTLGAYLSISPPVLIASLVVAVVTGVLIFSGIAARIVGYVQEFTD
jgi:TRAP-type uncharacterized transport system fused permease subunit